MKFQEQTATDKQVVVHLLETMKRPSALHELQDSIHAEESATSDTHRDKGKAVK